MSGLWGPDGEGGIYTGLGNQPRSLSKKSYANSKFLGLKDQLTVTMKLFAPHDYGCGLNPKEEAPDMFTCEDAFNKMRTSKIGRVFGWRSTSGVQVLLPAVVAKSKTTYIYSDHVFSSRSPDRDTRWMRHRA